MTVYVDQPEVREGQKDVPVSKYTYIGLYLSIAGMVVYNLRGALTTDDNELARSLIDLLLICSLSVGFNSVRVFKPILPQPFP